MTDWLDGLDDEPEKELGPLLDAMNKIYGRDSRYTNGELAERHHTMQCVELLYRGRKYLSEHTREHQRCVKAIATLAELADDVRQELRRVLEYEYERAVRARALQGGDAQGHGKKHTGRGGSARGPATRSRAGSQGPSAEQLRLRR